MTDRFDDQVIEILKRSGAGFMPSDTIYGLSCRALDEQAVGRAQKLKKRDSNKPLIVLISDVEMLNLLSISSSEVEPAKKYWPGPLTLICSAPRAPGWLQLGTKTLAVRIPSNKDLVNLIQKVGPIVSTSANLQGQKPLTTAAKAIKVFGEKLDFYIDAGKLTGKPSTLVEVEDGKLKIIRQGAMKLNEV